MREAWITDGVRTPRGKGKPSGALHDMHPQVLLGGVLQELVDRGLNAADVDDVIMGNGEHAGDHAHDIARSAVLTAGWPVKVPGLTLNRFCGGGQQAVMTAATGVLAGWQDVVVAGGVESMSRYSYAQPLDAGNAELRNRYSLVPQGIAADLIASLEGFDRQAVDGFAVASQDRAATAIKEGRFERSMAPVRTSDGNVLLDHDENIRPDTTLESLAQLPPSFERMGTKVREGGRTYDDMCRDSYPHAEQINHVHHAGNSSGVVDGAAAVVVASDEYAKAHGIRPRARIVCGAALGAEPVIMLTAPGPASELCLAKAGMTKDDIDLWEINEAFAAVPLKVMKDLQLEPDRVNVNGGAIALGHPIGATGAILFQTVIDELERRDLTTGLVTMCTGGGMATATIVERI